MRTLIYHGAQGVSSLVFAAFMGRCALGAFACALRLQAGREASAEGIVLMMLGGGVLMFTALLSLAFLVAAARGEVDLTYKRPI